MTDEELADERGKAVEGMYKTLDKIGAWLTRLAEAPDKQAAQNTDFETLRDACTADAKNFRATANSVSDAMFAYEEAKKNG